MNIKKNAFIIFMTCVMLFSISHAQHAVRLNILVHPFSNAGAKSYSWISAGLTDTVIADLMRLSSVNVFSEEERKKAIKEIELSMTGLVRDEDIAGVGKIMGAHLIFTGSYTVSGNSVRVIAKLVDVATAKVQTAAKIDGSLDALAELEDRIVVALVEGAENLHIKGITAPKFSNAEKETITKGYNPSAKAFEMYSKALDLADENAREAKKLASIALGSDPDYIPALVLFGNLANNLGDAKAAMESFAKAKRLLEKNNMQNSADYANLIAGIGLQAWNRGDNDRAIEYTEKAKQLWEAMGRKESLQYISTLVILGAAYRQLNNLPKALALTEEAHSALERLGMKMTSSYGWATSNLGVIHQSMGNYDKSMNIYREALDVFQKIGLKNSMGYAFTYSQIGGVYYMKGEYPSAIEYYSKGIGMCDNLGLQNTIQYSYYAWTLANSYWMLNQTCEGVPFIEKAAKVFRSVGHSETKKVEKAVEDFKRRCGK